MKIIMTHSGVRMKGKCNEAFHIESHYNYTYTTCNVLQRLPFERVMYVTRREGYNLVNREWAIGYRNGE